VDDRGLEAGTYTYIFFPQRHDACHLEVTGRQGRRDRKQLDDLKERRGYSHLREEALDRTMWTARLGTGFGAVTKQTAK
jgi:hypothetical protein